MVCVGISPHLPRYQFSAKNHCRILCQRSMEGPCSQDKAVRGREGLGAEEALELRSGGGAETFLCREKFGVLPGREARR